MKSLDSFKRELKEIIIGQDKAVEDISLALYRHFLRIKALQAGLKIEKSTNLLLIGGTGSGKTYTIDKAVELSGLPIIKINATELNAGPGWTGVSLSLKIEEGLKNILNNEFYSHPVIFIDEFDKICRPVASSNSDNINIAIQSNVLQYIEGMEFNIRTGGNQTLKLNSKDFLFVFAGAFSGMNEAESRSKNIGFFKEAPEKREFEDRLLEYGIMPELLGRIQNITELEKISQQAYIRIIQSKHFILNQWYDFLETLNVTDLDKHSLDVVQLSEKAYKRNLGVRGLVVESEKIINNILTKHPELLQEKKEEKPEMYDPDKPEQPRYKRW